MRSLVLAMVAALAVPTSGFAATYVTGTSSYSGLGDIPGGTFDEVTFHSASGSGFGPGTYLFNTIDFTVGPKSLPSGTYTGSFLDTISKDGGAPISFSVPYTLTTGVSDTITIGGNIVSYLGYNVKLNPLTLTSSGGTVTGSFSGTVTPAPEPAAWTLMILGFGGIGFAMRRRRTGIAAYA